MKQVFVSYVYEDIAHVRRLETWANQEGRLGDVHITGEADDVRQGGDAAIRNELAHRLHSAAALIVLVGNDSHNRRWLDYEVQYAKSHGKPIVVIRLLGTSGAPPPLVRNEPMIAFEPEAIRRALGS